MAGLSAAMVGLEGGTVGGNGGTITGLKTATLPLAGGTVGGSGGTMTGLARAKDAAKTRMNTERARRTWKAFEIMVVLLLSVKLCTKRVTQLCGNIYNKSNHFGKFQCPDAVRLRTNSIH